MHRLTRRDFGRGLGCVLALAGSAPRVLAHDGPHEVEVRISRFAFKPALVEIAMGDTVVWVNDDPAPHTATAADSFWDTGEMTRDTRAAITFDQPGEHPYLCTFHPQMQGTVVVRSESNH